KQWFPAHGIGFLDYGRDGVRWAHHDNGFGSGRFHFFDRSTGLVGLPDVGSSGDWRCPFFLKSALHAEENGSAESVIWIDHANFAVVQGLPEPVNLLLRFVGIRCAHIDYPVA